MFATLAQATIRIIENATQVSPRAGNITLWTFGVFRNEALTTDAVTRAAVGSSTSDLPGRVRGCIVIGIQISANWSSGPRVGSSATPITVNRVRFSRNDLPMMAGSPPNCRCHRP